MTLYLMNTTVIVTDGEYELKTITEDEAKKLINNNVSVVSSIGHTGTAEVMSNFLGIKIIPNRIYVEMKSKDVALCFKLNGRLPEGKILNKEELETLDYTWKLITKK